MNLKPWMAGTSPAMTGVFSQNAPAVKFSRWVTS